MIKHIPIFLTCLITLLSGCCSRPACNQTVPEEAVRMIRENQAECILCRGERIVYVERGRGVSPLLFIYDSHKQEMKGAVVVDKVIGRAAAFIAISGGAAHVHGQVMSEDALILLKKHGITASHEQLVFRILNRRRDGLCPLEQSVLGEEDPEKAMVALRKTISRLMKGGQNSK